MNAIKKFLLDETGRNLPEYAIAAGLVTLAVAATFTSLGARIEAVFDSLAGKFTGSFPEGQVSN